VINSFPAAYAYSAAINAWFQAHVEKSIYRADNQVNMGLNAMT